VLVEAEAIEKRAQEVVGSMGGCRFNSLRVGRHADVQGGFYQGRIRACKVAVPRRFCAFLRGPRSDRRAGLVWEPLVRGIRMSD